MWWLEHRLLRALLACSAALQALDRALLRFVRARAKERIAREGGTPDVVA